MADAAATEVAPGDAAEAALAFLGEMSPDLRGAAILDADGAVLAASGEPERWREDAAALFAVADRAGGEPVEQVHVATEQGEVFALRHDGLAAVAVTERFALASLMFFDMRSTLRDLARAERGGLMPPKPHRVLLDRVSGYADEAAAYMRRRRVARRPFARLYYPNGRSADHADDSTAGRRAVRRRRPPDRGRREAAEAMSELIDPAVAERVLARALANGGRFAEVFAERRHGLSMSIDESRIESVQSGAEEGAGVRVVDGGTTYFAHVDGLDPADLERAADEAAAALRGERREPRPLRGAWPATPLPIERRPEDVPAERKAALLRELDERARAQGGEIAQFTASYAEARREVAVANSDGLLSGDDRTRTRIGAQAVARRGDAVETGAETLGAHRGFELLEDDPGLIAEQAARKALTLLDAGPAPSGSMPVVVGGGFGGVLFHEMTGHGLEADHIQKGASVYVGKLGEQVAQPLLNAYDDGRLPGRVGQRRDRRRGRADPEDAGDRGRAPHRLPLRPPHAPSATASPRPATAAARASATCRSRA